jgi:hypothetical protein
MRILRLARHDLNQPCVRPHALGGRRSQAAWLSPEDTFSLGNSLASPGAQCTGEPLGLFKSDEETSDLPAFSGTKPIEDLGRVEAATYPVVAHSDWHRL